MRSPCTLATVSLALLLTAAGPRALHAETRGFRGPATAPFALSIGSPTDGALAGGVALRERAELRLRWPDGPRWALPGLVELLERASRHVDRRFPGSVLLVGDLSREGGGDLAGHASHESGRDADVGFYYSDPNGAAVRTDRLMPVRASGKVRERSPSGEALRFDDARNWALIEAVLTDSKTSVQRIFVAEVIKHRLLDYAAQHGASDDVVTRARALLKAPGSGPAHDDHFHVRIGCPRNQRDVCIQSPLPSASRERTAALAPASR